MRLKQRIFRNLLNIPGWRSKRKIVVIESDDWGSIRMPSKKVFERLQKKGFNPEKDPYLKYDCLESDTDLSNLFEVLSSIKDKNGNGAVLTANAVVANPDFQRIKKADFSAYFFEPITKTFERYPNHKHAFELWQEGNANRLFRLQFHGREHLNVDQWLQGLQAKDSLLLEAFQHEMLSISSCPSPMKYGYMEGLDFFSELEQKRKGQILKEGMSLFEDLLGYTSKSFIANCYIWDKSVESVLNTLGVQYLQGIVNQIRPVVENGVHRHKFVKHYFGQRNTFGQYYLLRNAFFEPSMTDKSNVVSECLNRVALAFRWGKPAVICSHRLNFIGGIDVKNRDENLKQLSSLLKQILTKWPDVEFMSSDQLGDLMSNQGSN